MRGERDQSPDRAFANLARQQHGTVSRAQLRAVGLSDDQIDRLLRCGRLRAVHRGVYAVGPLSLTDAGHRMAAALACGDQAVLSHRTAADLWGLRPCDTPRIEITVPRSGRRACAGITIHRTSALGPEDVTRLDALPVTTWPRTLLDLAEVVPPDHLTRALERADEVRVFDLTALDAVIARHRYRHGAAKLARALERYRPTPMTRSELERALRTMCAEHGLPRPEVNTYLGPYEVDFLWRLHRLVVETDGEEAHGTRAAFQDDRARDAHLLTKGWRTVRFTHAQVHRRPDHVAATLRELLK
ncbi:MAG TPA: DUF559 domain-containing protein [Solirubrobacteraceae bacterium]|nr:DUF559 domain-containing protein [Solirubrobacteraceae bacterium]